MAFRRQQPPAAMHQHPDFTDSIDESDSDSESTSASSSSSSSSTSTGYFPSPVRSFRSSLSTASYVTSASESYVYCDDPSEYWGWGGYMGAVTRVVDRDDNPGTRFAAHFMSGPFAQMSKKELRKRRRRRSSGGSEGSVRMVGGPAGVGPAGPAGGGGGGYAMHGGAGGIPPPPRPMMPGAAGGGGHYNFGAGGGAGGVRPGMMPAGWGPMGGGPAMSRQGIGRTVDPLWGTQAPVPAQRMPAGAGGRVFPDVKRGGPARTGRP